MPLYPSVSVLSPGQAVSVDLNANKPLLTTRYDRKYVNSIFIKSEFKKSLHLYAIGTMGSAFVMSIIMALLFVQNIRHRITKHNVVRL